jgi:hypothetical protein
MERYLQELHTVLASLKKSFGTRILEQCKDFTLKLRLFRCKTFYIVKYFQMQMISGKIIFFSVCLHFRKMLRKIFYAVCLEQRKTN